MMDQLRKIAALAAKGKTAEEIATELGLSPTWVYWVMKSNAFELLRDEDRQ